MVVHGIPGPYRVADGDLITIDVGVTLDGAIADSAYTFGVGDDRRRRRSGCSTSARTRSPPGSRRRGPATGSATSRTPCRRSSRAAGFSVVRSLVGHGVGRHYHEDPHVPNFGQPGRGPRLSEGMTIAIEPMITVGRARGRSSHDDGWSISTEDGSLAAHFEHTVAILPQGRGS